MPAKQWQRWDASHINAYTKNSWRQCIVETRKLVDRAEAEAKAKAAEKKSNKRKRKVSKPTPTLSTHDNLQVAEMVLEHIGNIHAQLRIIERLLATIRK